MITEAATELKLTTGVDGCRVAFLWPDGFFEVVETFRTAPQALAAYRAAMAVPDKLGALLNSEV